MGLAATFSEDTGVVDDSEQRDAVWTTGVCSSTDCISACLQERHSSGEADISNKRELTGVRRTTVPSHPSLLSRSRSPRCARYHLNVPWANLGGPELQVLIDLLLWRRRGSCPRDTTRSQERST